VLSVGTAIITLSQILVGWDMQDY